MTWSAPLWLLLLLPLLAWLWWRRRPGEAVALDTGALALWEAAPGTASAVSTRRQRLAAAEWALMAAWGLGSLALAGPRAQAPRPERRLEVWVERLPGALLPVEPGSGESRLGSALEALAQAVGQLPDERRPQRWLWRSPGLAPFETTDVESARARLLSAPAEPTPLAYGAADRPGCLWLLLDPPEPRPLQAAWWALTGAAVPGPLTLELDPAPGAAPRTWVWDGANANWSEELRLAPGRLELDPGLPPWLDEFARIWAEQRGLAVESSSASGTLQPADSPLERCLKTGLVLFTGPALTRAQLLEFGDFSSNYTPEPAGDTQAGDPGLSSADATAISPGKAPAVDPGLSTASSSQAWIPTPLWELPGAEGGMLVLALPGGIQWAAGDYSQPTGDPLRSALELCRLLDRARRWPAECLPLEQRLARPASSDRGSAEAALERALQSAARLRGESAPSAQASNSGPPAGKAKSTLFPGSSWSHWPALLAALSALGALLLWSRAPRP